MSAARTPTTGDAMMVDEITAGDHNLSDRGSVLLAHGLTSNTLAVPPEAERSVSLKAIMVGLLVASLIPAIATGGRQMPIVAQAKTDQEAVPKVMGAGADGERHGGGNRSEPASARAGGAAWGTRPGSPRAE